MTAKKKSTDDSDVLTPLQRKIRDCLASEPPITIKEALEFKMNPKDYLVGELGWLKRKSTALFTGLTGQGKTVMAEQLGMSAACGIDFFGKVKVFKPMKVLYVDCENGIEVISRDLKSIAKNLNLPMPLLEKNFVIVHNYLFKDEEFHAYLLELVLLYGPDLIILDNLQGLCTADINKNESFNNFIIPVQEITKKANAALILMDHASKPSKDGNNLSHAYGAYLGSGTARKANWARVSFELTNYTSDNRFRLNFSKSGQWAGIKDVDGKTTNHFFVEQSGDPAEPYWKLAESQAPAIRGIKSEIDMKELKAIQASSPDLTQADLAEHFDVSLKTISRAVKKIKDMENGILTMPKRKKQ